PLTTGTFDSPELRGSSICRQNRGRRSSSASIMTGSIRTPLSTLSACAHPWPGAATCASAYTLSRRVAASLLQPFNTRATWQPEIVFVVSGPELTGVTTNLHCTPCNPVTAFVSGGSLFVNWEGAGGQVGDTVTVDFTVAGRVSAVPGPMLGAGLPGLI